MSCCKPTKKPEAGQLRDFARDEIADFVKVVDVAPRIDRQLFDANGNALIGLVHFGDLGFNFVAFL